MPTSPYFQRSLSQPEARLMQDITDEMIRVNGVDVYYLPRKHVNIDPLFLQDPLSRFDQAVLIGVYLKTYEGFQGDGDLMSKFGLSVSDRMTLSLSITEFEKEVGFRFQFPRPQEGDLIYFPLSKGLFEIKFVEHEGVFYQSGHLSFYDITCEKFEYSSETFDTGIISLDHIDQDYSFSAQVHSFLSEDGANMIVGETDEVVVQEDFDIDTIDTVSQNKVFHDQANTILDWGEKDPFSESGFVGKTG